MPNEAKNARNELLYVSETAPATATDPTGYTKVGLLTSNSLSGDREEIRGSNKEQVMQAVHLGDGSASLDVGFERATIQDAGQALMEDNRKADPAPNLHWLVSDNVEGNTCRHGQGKVTSFSVDSENNSMAAGSATIAIDGDYTREPVPAAAV